MQLRRGVILGLTLIGILLLALVTANRTELFTWLGVGCWIVAIVYALLTRPTRG